MVRQYRNRYKEGVEGYIEEGIVRRELADNFCYYNENYDNIDGKIVRIILLLFPISLLLFHEISQWSKLLITAFHV